MSADPRCVRCFRTLADHAVFNETPESPPDMPLAIFRDLPTTGVYCTINPPYDPDPAHVEYGKWLKKHNAAVEKGTS